MQTLKGTLKHGLKIGDRALKNFELRELTTSDMFAAEADASVDTPLKFNGALMARQLVRIDDYEGPFTLGLLGNLKPVDYSILRAAQMELEKMGEGS